MGCGEESEGGAAYPTLHLLSSAPSVRILEFRWSWANPGMQCQESWVPRNWVLRDGYGADGHSWGGEERLAQRRWEVEASRA